MWGECVTVRGRGRPPHRRHRLLAWFSATRLVTGGLVVVGSVCSSLARRDRQDRVFGVVWLRLVFLSYVCKRISAVVVRVPYLDSGIPYTSALESPSVPLAHMSP